MDFLESNIAGYGKDRLTCDDIGYLNKYWIDADILSLRWSNLLEASFVIRDNIVSISPKKAVDVRMGGVLFTESEFNKFSSDAIDAGAKGLMVVEDIGQQGWHEHSQLSFYRFKFPLPIAWGELARACQIAEDVFLRPIRSFFVVADNGRIGKYVNNDADPPYELFFIQ